MAYSTVEDILLAGRLSLEDFPESELELAIAEAGDEIDLRIPPISSGSPIYPYYQRRLPMIKRAHCYLALSYVMSRLSYEEITHGLTGDPLTLPDIGRGAVTPEKNTIAQFYADESKRYREMAEKLISQAEYFAPVVRRPKPLEL